MWSRRPHPNILPLLGASDRKFIMVSEWMANGNIREYVLANPSVNRPSLVSRPILRSLTMCSLR